jgi:perosamine synthetase
MSQSIISGLSANVVDGIRRVIGPGPAVLHEPCFQGNEWEYVKECIDSSFVSSVGKFVDQFESGLADYTGAARAIAVANGTAALHIALLLVGVSRNEEVLAPALSFVATANAITYCGGIPHFVESDERTLGVDASALRTYLRDITTMRGGVCFNSVSGRRIRALVPMHTFGHPADIEGLLDVAAEFGLVLIEDAAESLGSTYDSRHTGTFGRIGTLSFNGNKTITTGGGGAILTSDSALAARAKHLTTTAKVPHRWEFVHDEVGFNYRMPNINAALGCAQLEQLPKLIEAKRALHTCYAASFADVKGVRLLAEPLRARSNYWLQTLLLDESHASERDTILGTTNDVGLMTRPAWTLMHRLAAFSHLPRMPLAVAESLSARLINIPSSAQLGVGAGA